MWLKKKSDWLLKQQVSYGLEKHKQFMRESQKKDTFVINAVHHKELWQLRWKKAKKLYLG